MVCLDLDGPRSNVLLDQKEEEEEEEGTRHDGDVIHMHTWLFFSTEHYSIHRIERRKNHQVTSSHTYRHGCFMKGIRNQWKNPLVGTTLFPPTIVVMPWVFFHPMINK